MEKILQHNVVLSMVVSAGQIGDQINPYFKAHLKTELPFAPYPQLEIINNSCLWAIVAGVTWDLDTATFHCRCVNQEHAEYLEFTKSNLESHGWTCSEIITP